MIMMRNTSQESLCRCRGDCALCNCTGRTCPNLYPGYKVEWPELKGMNATKAKIIIESDNPFVTAWIFPIRTDFPTINCCKRVLLFTPNDYCPDGPVLNQPFVG